MGVWQPGTNLQQHPQTPVDFGAAPVISNPFHYRVWLQNSCFPPLLMRAERLGQAR